MQQPCLVISGASRGIGLATAERFLEAGYKVINLSRRKPPLEGIHHIEADMSEPGWINAVESALLATVEGASPLVLIHNAGLLLKDTVDDVDLAPAMQINVIAAAQLNRVLLPRMLAGSSVIYVGSTLSEKAVSNTFSYSVSKHAVVGMMRATCQDLAGRDIHTACVCPGFTETEMLVDHVGGSDEVLEAIAGNMTFNRLIEPGEIAETLYFAAANPVINGAILHANLGQVEH